MITEMLQSSVVAGPAVVLFALLTHPDQQLSSDISPGSNLLLLSRAITEHFT